jgi:allantoicase
MATTQQILDKMHEIREQLLADSGGALEGLVARMQKEQQLSGRIIRKTRRTNRLTGVAVDASFDMDASPPQPG